MAFHSLLIPFLVIVILLLFDPTLSSSDLEPVIDPDTKSFIHSICDRTRNLESCGSIFSSNLPNPDSDPKTLTSIAIDQALEAIDEYLGHIKDSKKRICEQSLLVMKNSMEDLKVMINGEKLKLTSMEKISQIFGETGGKTEDEIGKCESRLKNRGVGIEERNKKIGILIEMVMIAGEELVKVMDMGSNERENCCGFLPFLFHG